ncbi:MAG: hypothetical protein NTY19_44435 [Planctomycetota bacterium]|nr:hypothetical protein [Planctomycetota bacterium]
MRSDTSQLGDSFDDNRAERGVRGPRHRLCLAGELPYSPRDPRLRRYDEKVRAAHHFSTLVAEGSDGAKRARALYPLVAAAFALNEDAATVARLKICVLADLDEEETVCRTGVDIAVLRTWEALFFDARKCREAIGWVASHIIHPEVAAGNLDLAAKLKLVAALGQLGAVAILDADSRVSVSAGEQLFQKKLALHLKYDRAMTMTEGPKDHFRFIRLYSQLKMQEHRLKVQETKVAEKCNAALRKHELAQFRLEIERERQQVQAAREARKIEELSLVENGARFMREHIAAQEDALDLAELKEAEARAASSPLARLRWARGENPMEQVSTSSEMNPAHAKTQPEVLLPVWLTAIALRSVATAADRTAV